MVSRIFRVELTNLSVFCSVTYVHDTYFELCINCSLARLVGYLFDQGLANLILLVNNRLGDNLVSLVLHSFGFLLLWFAAKG